jgi:hypothetical protein
MQIESCYTGCAPARSLTWSERESTGSWRWVVGREGGKGTAAAAAAAPWYSVVLGRGEGT